jgi:tRNA nucleotidyltransferase/poly(A) polymerase
MSKVLPSEWEAPEHISLSEREFLVDRAETINGIIAASYLQVGQVLLQVKKKFKSDPELNGWFKRWCEETLPFTYQKAGELAKIAEECHARPEVAEAASKMAYKTLYGLLSTRSESAKESMLQAVLSGEKLTQTDISEIKNQPEIQLETAQALVEQIEATLLGYQLKQSDPQMISRQKVKLAKAMQQLQEKQAAVDSLEKTRSTQELVLLQLRKQLNQKQVFIENLTLDPNQNRQRDLAKTVVDATRALDMLLASFDRYSTDKTELGAQAIETIERKMEEVKHKLHEHYAAEAT